MTTVSELPLARRRERDQYRLAVQGLIPAEALPTHLRWRLICDLHRLGLTDSEIGEHTATTEYTVRRIRTGMGLSPNRSVNIPQPRRAVAGS